MPMRKTKLNTTSQIQPRPCVTGAYLFILIDTKMRIQWIVTTKG